MLRLPQPAGLTQMLKDGTQHLQGIDEAVLRNVEAVKNLANIVKTSLGPNGRNKMVINHLDKLFVTNDAATIIRELEVVHPAARVVVLASQQQDAECGDSTNMVVVLAGELLSHAEELLRMGLHPSDVIEGYDVALEKIMEVIDSSAVTEINDFHSREQLLLAVKAAISSKQHGYEQLIGGIVVDAALSVMPKNPKNFNVDNIRVVKIMGASIHETRVLKGMVFGREPESHVKRAENAKIAVFAGPLDANMTETKGTVLLKSKKDLLNFSKGEEAAMDQKFKEIAATGAKVLVTGSSVGDMALHHANRYGFLVMKVLSKFDLRRLCRAVKATPLNQLTTPAENELGYCDIVECVEIGGDHVTVFRQEKEGSQTATIVIRGGTRNHMDDVERAVDDGISVIKSLIKDPRLVAGAGGCEIELACKLHAIADQTEGPEQYGIKAFSECFETFPRTLADNAGFPASEVLAQLTSEHQLGQQTFGIDIKDRKQPVKDVLSLEMPVVDSLHTKKTAIIRATEAALTVLRVDQIIMSKQAGGPKAPKQENWDED